jgi:hypothetical protein
MCKTEVFLLYYSFARLELLSIYTDCIFQYSAIRLYYFHIIPSKSGSGFWRLSTLDYYIIILVAYGFGAHFGFEIKAFIMLDLDVTNLR